MAESYNELFGIGVHSEPASSEGRWLFQDDAASTVVDDQSSNGFDGTASQNTSDLSTTGPTSYLPSAFELPMADFVGLTDISGLEGVGELTFCGWMRLHSTATPTADLRIFGKWITPGIYTFTSYNGGTKLAWAVNGTTGFGGVQTITSLSTLGTSWHHFVLTYKNGVGLKIYLDGSDNTTTWFGTASGLTRSAAAELFAGRDDDASSPGLGTDLADWSAFAYTFTSADAAQAAAGPELNYSSGVSFASNGAYDVGTWALPSPFASGSNGTATYEVIAVKADGTVLDSTTTATGTLDLSANAGNTCYLLARVSNTGGYDIGDNATRTSSYGSANDGYYEIASVLAAGGGVTITVASAIHSHAADSPAITQTHVVAVNDADHSQTTDSPTVTQTHAVAAADADHSHAADSPAITQTHVIVAADADHAQTADNVTVTVNAVSIVAADADHAQTSDSPTITQTHIVAAADADHVHTADNTTVTQTHSVIVADATHSHAVDNVTVTVAGVSIDVDDADHGQTVDSPGITQTHVIVVAGTLHDHSADNVTITVSALITGPAGIEFTTTGRPADFTLEVSRLDYTTTGRPADFTLDAE